MFQVGDKVAHPGHGGCMVAEICVQKRGDEPVQYLVLVPENEPGTRILAPVENAHQIGLRSIITEEAADQLLETFSEGDAGLIWESNHAKRRQAYVDVLKTGSLDDLASMIRELSLQPKLSNGDKELLPRAQRKLFSEIALAKAVNVQLIMNMVQLRMQPSPVTT